MHGHPAISTGILQLLCGVIRCILIHQYKGRGAYVCRNAECLKKALKQKQLERAFSCTLGEETHAALLAELESLEGQDGED